MMRIIRFFRLTYMEIDRTTKLILLTDSCFREGSNDSDAFSIFFAHINNKCDIMKSRR